MKHFNLLKTLLLLCALIVGSLSGWAQSDKSSDYTGNITLSTAGGSNASSCLVVVNKTNYNGIKAGTSSKVGAVKISVPQGTKYLHLHAAGWNGENVTLAVSPTGYSENISLSANSGISGNSPFTFSGSPNSSDYYKVITFTSALAANTDLTFTASTGKRFVIWGVTSEEIGGGTGGNTVDAPTFSPAAGAITAGTTVTLTQASADEIRYTLDGTNPTKTTGTVYSSPIEITTATTIKAIAIEGDDVSSVATAAYTIDVATPTFSLESGSYLVGSTFSMSASGNKIYYNLTTDGSEPAKPTTSSTEYTTPIVISGKTRIKAIAVDSYGNTSNVVTRTYTGIAPAVLPFSWTGTSSEGKAELGKITGVEVSLSSDYAASNAPYRLKFDAVGKNVIIYTDVKPYMVSFTAKLYNATSDGSKLTVQESVDGIEFTDVEDFVIDGLANSTFSFTTTNSFNANTRAVKLVMTEKDQNVGVGTIVVTKAEPITISSAGWAASVVAAASASGAGVEVVFPEAPHAARDRISAGTTIPIFNKSFVFFFIFLPPKWN